MYVCMSHFNTPQLSKNELKNEVLIIAHPPDNERFLVPKIPSIAHSPDYVSFLVTNFHTLKIDLRKLPPEGIMLELEEKSSETSHSKGEMLELEEKS